METWCMIIKSVVQMRFKGMPISSPEIHRVILPLGRRARGRYILPLIISLQEQFLPCRGPLICNFAAALKLRIKKIEISVQVLQHC